MAEVEKMFSCDNCGSVSRLIYDSEEIRYEPEYCPFCGEIAEVVFDDEFDEDELGLDDDGLGEDDDHHWN